MREVFSRIGSRIWYDTHSVAVLLICAALIGRRAFLFTAAVTAALRIVRRTEPQEEAPPAKPSIATLRAVERSPQTSFHPPRDFVPFDVPNVSSVRAELEHAVVGQAGAVEALMLGLIANGHVLLEGAPGLGKTVACKALSRAVDASFSRIQCNADLTPADIAGCEIFDQRDLTFRFRRGPVFANVVFIDELNRAPARAQAALLEAMEECSITAGTASYVLPDPFFVLATMNEAEADGIFPLPAAQLDRFLLKVVLDFPSAEEDLAILERSEAKPGLAERSCVSLNAIRRWREAARAVYCAARLKQYVADVVRATRAAAGSGQLESGAGPRAGLAILRAARARAILCGRAYTLPSDVRCVALPALVHRVMFPHAYLLTREDRQERLRTIVQSIPLP